MKEFIDCQYKREKERLEVFVESLKKFVLYEQFFDASKKFNLSIL